MKTITFDKDADFWKAGTTTTIDDKWADQLIKAKKAHLTPAEAQITFIAPRSLSQAEVNNEGNDTNNPPE